MCRQPNIWRMTLNLSLYTSKTRFCVIIMVTVHIPEIASLWSHEGCYLGVDLIRTSHLVAAVLDQPASSSRQ